MLYVFPKAITVCLEFSQCCDKTGFCKVPNWAVIPSGVESVCSPCMFFSMPQNRPSQSREILMFVCLKKKKLSDVVMSQSSTELTVRVDESCHVAVDQHNEYN